jgi:AraC-like DNA-binding protein
MKFRKNPASGDPSSIQQSFEKIEMNVHCCRYWWLRRWRHQRLSFPYWRLYWNKIEGAFVFFEKQVDLGPERIILIPPYTPFYTGIRFNESDDETYCLEGGWIQSGERERNAISEGFIPHFFIHFNLGYHYDSISPGIYPVALNQIQQELIEELTGNLMKGSNLFDLRHSLSIYELVLSSVNEIPEDAWEEFTIGKNIQKVLNHINQHLGDVLPNPQLADLAHMAPYSFARLFKQQTGLSPQDFIRKKRVEHASKLLYHTDWSIKQISGACGFNDRYYFTRVFARVMGVPPANYRKNLRLNRIYQNLQPEGNGIQK